eukprot:gene20922-22977_t
MIKGICDLESQDQERLKAIDDLERLATASPLRKTLKSRKLKDALLSKEAKRIGKNLLRLTKIKKRELDYKFVWTRNGSIYIQKNESARYRKLTFQVI